MDRKRAEELNQAAKELLWKEDPACFTKNSWAKIYVEAEKPISRKLYDDFIDELTSDNVEYRKALEASVQWFGVRWV